MTDWPSQQRTFVAERTAERDARLRKEAESFAAAHKFELFGLHPCPCGDDLAGECRACNALANERAEESK